MAILTRPAERCTPSIGETGSVADESKLSNRSICFHCLEPMPKYGNLTANIGGHVHPMCCIGCKSAAQYIDQQGLTKFYDHRDRLNHRDFFSNVAKSVSVSAAEAGSAIEDQWLFLDRKDTSSAYVSYGDPQYRCISVLVEGLYCSSCSWLIQRALNTVSSNIECHIDVDSKCVHIKVSDPRVVFSNVMITIAQLGYKPTALKIGSHSDTLALAKTQRNEALKRILVAGLGMMQVMTYATAGYFAGNQSDPNIDSQQARFLLLVSMLVATVIVFYSGKPFFQNAWSDLKNRHLGMDVPISLAIAGAYFPSVYHVLFRIDSHVYFDSAVMFVFFLSVGRYVEMRARHRLSGSSVGIAGLLPEKVRVRRTKDSKSSMVDIAPNGVKLGDQCELKASEVAPFDAKIVEGRGQFDESLFCGESLPVERAAGDSVLAGSVLLSGAVTVEAIQTWGNSSIAKVQKCIQSAERVNADEQQRNSLLSRYFILFTLILTTVTAGAWLTIDPGRVFEVCLAMLIATCPCAFALAAPVGRSAAIHALRRCGVLLTNNTALASMQRVSHWCFDKTGTLTEGRPSVYDVFPQGTLSRERCLELVACIEREADHVLSTAFNTIETSLVAHNIKEVVGSGISAEIGQETYRVGKRDWVLRNQVNRHTIPDPKSDRTELILSNNSNVLAVIELTDEIRPSAPDFVRNLRSTCTTVKTTILSGDRKEVVSKIADRLQIADHFANLSPSEKLAKIDLYQEQGEVVAMVGDGVNDAPVLAGADVSIAMASGSHLAMNNADVILLNGNLRNLLHLLKVATRTAWITRQNLVWALLYNLTALPLAACGLLTPWIAALGMSLSSLLVVLNALRIHQLSHSELETN